MDVVSTILSSCLVTILASHILMIMWMIQVSNQCMGTVELEVEIGTPIEVHITFHDRKFKIIELIIGGNPPSVGSWKTHIMSLWKERMVRSSVTTLQLNPGMNRQLPKCKAIRNLSPSHILIISINYDSQSKATLLKYRYAQSEPKTFQVKSIFTHTRHATNLAVHPLAVSHIF